MGIEYSNEVTPEQTAVLTSASEARVDRVNVMAYGPPGCGKTYFATTCTLAGMPSLWTVCAKYSLMPPGWVSCSIRR